MHSDDCPLRDLDYAEKGVKRWLPAPAAAQAAAATSAAATSAAAPAGVCLVGCY